MNHSVPDWYMEDNSRSSRKKSPAPENELVELLWRNGHVVMQSQSNRKPPSTAPESRQEPKLDPSTKYGCTSVGNSSSGLIQDDGPSSWLQYSFDDPLEREFSEFFSGIPMEDTAVGTNKRNMDLLEEEEEGEGDVWFSVDEEANALCMPPPKFGSTQKAPGLGNSGFVNVLSCSRPPMDDLGSRSGAVAGIGESSSARTVGSSACGSSNQPDTGHDMSNGATEVRVSRVKDAQTNPINPTVTTSSSGSGCSFGRTAGQQSASNQNHKRKGRDCHSEEADYESIEANRPSQRSGSTRKSRAAEVHNLSERKRRDRINEKMKALQELIPHCNKADKASMLDEAIEYLKSLQLQLQIMWMGSGMAPMMFPIGMGHAPMPSINNPVQIQSPRVPLVNHSMPTPTASANQMPMRQSPVFNPISFPTQMQNARLPESSYARYVGVPHLQLVPQAMNLYAYGSHIVQQNQTAAAVGTCSLPTAGIPCEKIQNGQSG